MWSHNEGSTGQNIALTPYEIARETRILENHSRMGVLPLSAACLAIKPHVQKRDATVFLDLENARTHKKRGMPPVTYGLKYARWRARSWKRLIHTYIRKRVLLSPAFMQCLQMSRSFNGMPSETTTFLRHHCLEVRSKANAPTVHALVVLCSENGHTAASKPPPNLQGVQGPTARQGPHVQGVCLPPCTTAAAPSQIPDPHWESCRTPAWLNSRLLQKGCQIRRC
jgi:hypothetical protein